jgi:hypothetical protein
MTRSTADGTIHGITEDGTTHGITEVGAGTTGTDITTTHTTADGMADGILTITAISTDRDTFMTNRENITSRSEARDIRPDPTGYSPEVHPSEAEAP